MQGWAEACSDGWSSASVERGLGAGRVTADAGAGADADADARGQKGPGLLRARARASEREREQRERAESERARARAGGRQVPYLRQCCADVFSGARPSRGSGVRLMWMCWRKGGAWTCPATCSIPSYHHTSGDGDGDSDSDGNEDRDGDGDGDGDGTSDGPRLCPPAQPTSGERSVNALPSRGA